MQLSAKLSMLGTFLPGRTDAGDRRGATLLAAFRLALLWILAPTVLVGSAVLAAGYMQAQLYDATTFIHVASQGGQGARSVLPASAGSEMQLVRSLARRVLTELKLDRDPEFSQANGLNLAQLAGRLGLDATSRHRKNEALLVDAVAERLSIRPLEAGRILSISFVARDPQVAARVAEGVAVAYVALLRDAEREQASAAATLLSSRIANLRTRIGQLRSAPAQDQSTPPDASERTAADARVASLQAEAERLRAALAGAREKAAAFRGHLQAGGLLEITDDPGSQRLRRLVERRLTLRAELAEASREAASATEAGELGALLAELDREIRVEGARCASSLDAEASQLATRLADTERQVEVETTAADQATEMSGRSDAGRIAAATLVQELERELAFTESADAARSGQAEEVRLLAPAKAVPLDGGADRLATAAYAASAVGAVMLVAIGGVFLGGYRRPRDEHPMRNPVILGEERPYGSFRQLGASGPTASPRRGSFSGCVEVGDAKIVDALAAQLVVQSREGRGLRILVTAVGGENQGPISTALARALSAAGRRVIIVETAAGCQTLAVPGSAGLSQLLTSAATFADVIHRDPRSRVHFIGSGTEGGQSGADHERLAVVVDALTLTYDFVLLAGGDVEGAAGLAPFVDAGILVTSASAGSLATRSAHDGLLRLGIADVVVLLAARSAADSGNADRAA